MPILQEQKSASLSTLLKVAFGYSVIAPALLYLLHPCSRTAFAESAMDGANVQNAGAILFLLLFIRVLPQGLLKPSAIFFNLIIVTER